MNALVKHLFHRSPNPPRPKLSKARLGIESLEDRLVPAAIVSLEDGVLRATCDNAATAVTLSHAGTTTTLNGKSFADGTFSRIEILGGNANDAIRVLGTPAGTPVSIRAGGGNDAIHLG